MGFRTGTWSFIRLASRRTKSMEGFPDGHLSVRVKAVPILYSFVIRFTVIKWTKLCKIPLISFTPLSFTSISGCFWWWLTPEVTIWSEDNFCRLCKVQFGAPSSYEIWWQMYLSNLKDSLCGADQIVYFITVIVLPIQQNWYTMPPRKIECMSIIIPNITGIDLMECMSINIQNVIDLMECSVYLSVHKGCEIMSP